ncbi:hypothetical protein DENSPDRAFT_835911 [Dentipellis sp. KUC8613]|nr:hypothetical protein DENSPDRAFT_835911 [Dentipellis sp. KUC8613]
MSVSGIVFGLGRRDGHPRARDCTCGAAAVAFLVLGVATGVVPRCALPSFTVSLHLDHFHRIDITRPFPRPSPPSPSLVLHPSSHPAPPHVRIQYVLHTVHNPSIYWYPPTCLHPPPIYLLTHLPTYTHSFSISHCTMYHRPHLPHT